MRPSVWLPYVETGTGSDTFTKDMADGLADLGASVHLQPFSRKHESVPFLLRRFPPPGGSTSVLANSWNAFAFARPGLKLVTVEHLFVLDQNYLPFKSSFQKAAHEVLLRRYLKWSYRVSDALIVPSAYTAKAVSSVYPEFAPTVIHNGVDIDFFAPPRRDLQEPKPTRLLFVSSHTRRKGFDLLPSIMERLGPGYALAVAGEPAAELKHAARFLGRLDRKGVRAAYQNADILLMPTHLEGLPLAALEAMACGLPVVAFDSSSMSEVVEHEVTGLLAPDNDVDAFVAAVKSVRADPAAFDRMSRNARMRAVDKFDRRRVVQSYYDLICQLSRSSGLQISATR